jgi:CheY-like chemotaxis protein
MAKVLIVEDDELILRMYQKIFRAGGYQVDVAGDGQEGLAKAYSALPDIIILDIMMPKMDGMETLKQLKSTPELSEIPVLILTNLTGMGDAEAALQLGAVKYLSKSDYKPKEVFEIVSSLMAGYSRS